MTTMPNEETILLQMKLYKKFTVNNKFKKNTILSPI